MFRRKTKTQNAEGIVQEIGIRMGYMDIRVYGYMEPGPATHPKSNVKFLPRSQTPVWEPNSAQNSVLKQMIAPGLCPGVIKEKVTIG
jgi:hypothetical protein